MSKVVSFILVLVLFFGSAINIFADDDKPDEKAPILVEVAIVVGVVIVGGLLLLGIGNLIIKALSQANDETSDDGIKLVSAEDEAPSVTTDGKTILDVLKHIEAGVTPNKDIYVGLRFQY